MFRNISAAAHVHPRASSAATAGRALRAGDVLHSETSASATIRAHTADSAHPAYTNEWEIGVLYGPHGAPDFFTDEDIEMFFATAWKVHYNSDRTGVRLIGPKPQWARKDGGEAGLHPSNIHDNAYAIGTIDFTGDMPVILGPDGPSLGGFVCPATIVHAELWKMGQLKPGDTVRFRASHDRAERRHGAAVETQHRDARRIRCRTLPRDRNAESPILREPRRWSARRSAIAICSSSTGRTCSICELRFRVHALEAVAASRRPARASSTSLPASVRCRFTTTRCCSSRRACWKRSMHAESALPALDDIAVPSRIVHLPLSWDDPATRLAIEKYMQSVRPDAPWCPSNIEFIRRINGLDSIDDVKRIVFDASYLVLGLGDVYLGAPVATPLDPRHRLVTTKYNPARTWTPENAVGIGGAYLCVYGMEGPGGYQFVGRTVQMWNTLSSHRGLRAGKPWLLRFFDQIRFYPVSADELLEYRDAFPHGRFHVRTEETTFGLSDCVARRGGAPCSSDDSRLRSTRSANAGQLGAERIHQRAACDGGATEG